MPRYILLLCVTPFLAAEAPAETVHVFAAASTKDAVEEVARAFKDEAGDVRAALTLAVKGEVDAAVVYVTDANAAGDKVRTAFVVPDDLHKPIRYPVVLLKRDGIKAEAKRFYEYLAGDKAAAVFRK